MATKKTTAVNKISDKLASVGENFTVYMYDNGFVFEISGKDEDDNWPTAKILVKELDQLLELVKEAVTMPKND